MAGIKQLVVLRRKAGLTRQEFFDYHYRVHGAISTAPNPRETPQKYFQTHFEDSAFHANGPDISLNAHPSWAFSDDITELYFESEEHLQRVFQSDWVREKVGPDGVNFSDFSSVIPMFVEEKSLSRFDSEASQDINPRESSRVSVYFVSTAAGFSDLDKLVLSFSESLHRHASEGVRAVVVNTPAQISFDMRKYFGGSNSPKFDLIFTVYLKGSAQQSEIRKAQINFEREVASFINLEMCWIAFGERAVILDQSEKIKAC
ncbi:unnamed protein product [Penicillium pancosmium]